MEEKYEQLYNIVGDITFVFFAITILFGVFKWKSLGINITRFFYYTFAVFVYNGIEQIFIWSVKIYTSWWIPWLNKFSITDTNFMALYGRLIDIAFLLPFYFLILELNPRKNWRIAYWALLLICILIAIYIDGWRNYGTVNSIINRGLLIILPMAYFWKLYRQLPSLSLWKNPYFLISLGLLIPNLLSIVMSFIGDKLSATDYVLFIKVSLFRNFVSLIGQLLFIRAFLFARFEKFLS